MVDDKLLVKYGFVKDKYKSLYNDNIERIDKFVKESDKKLKDYADNEQQEIQIFPRVTEQSTGYPDPVYKHRLIFEAENQYIEGHYFWVLDQLRHDWNFPDFHKITDIFAASEQSAFFGVSEQRLGLQQDKAAQFLRGISEMVKALFQLVRELRIIDERLAYYNDTYEGKRNAVSSEITLKGIWIDQVEGGVKNAASVYGLSQTVGFTLLPDLFFRVTPKEPEDVDSVVDALEFNMKVKEVLKRKLRQYAEWKKRTYAELSTRRKFTIKYLRQHYDTIKLYMGWVKPYLRNIRRLQLDQKHMESADLIGAFEGAMVEIEVLAVKSDFFQGGKYAPCMLVHFLYRTRPSMTYTQEGYQRGPAHVGKFEMNLKGYVWTKEQVNNYLRMKEDEDLELLSTIDKSTQEGMDALGEEFRKYLVEGGEMELLLPEEDKSGPKKEKKPQIWSGIGEPFKALASGFSELFGGLFSVPNPFGKSGKEDEIALEKQYSGAKKTLALVLYQTYKNYKKAHGFAHW